MELMFLNVFLVLTHKNAENNSHIQDAEAGTQYTHLYLQPQRFLFLTVESVPVPGTAELPGAFGPVRHRLHRRLCELTVCLILLNLLLPNSFLLTMIYVIAPGMRGNNLSPILY